MVVKTVAIGYLCGFTAKLYDPRLSLFLLVAIVIAIAFDQFADAEENSLNDESVALICLAWIPGHFSFDIIKSLLYT